MYEKFYGLSGKPFLLNPDPKFFYRSTGHKRAMAYMQIGRASCRERVESDVGGGAVKKKQRE